MTLLFDRPDGWRNKLMSEVKVIRRWNRPGKAAAEELAARPLKRTTAEVKLVAIGVSTGGPRTLEETRSSLAALPVELSPAELAWLNLET